MFTVLYFMYCSLDVRCLLRVYFSGDQLVIHQSVRQIIEINVEKKIDSYLSKNSNFIK